MQRNDLVGRIIGILVFLGGVGLLAFVFSLAYTFFTSSVGGLQGAKAPGGTVAAQLGQSAVVTLARIALLIVMTIVGSLLASRGIQLYFAATGSRHVHRDSGE